jgi:hypothetical protein
MNPFPKAPSGSYKSLLVEGLKNIGRETEAKEFENGNMKLAIANSITGNVRTFSDLNNVCLKALETLQANDVVRYYFWGLANGQFIVASSNGAYVYDPDNVVAAAYAKTMAEASDREIIHPYFTN